MAETKNTFIKSKMNQDLDQRLVPNGEYREAYNISVSQAEGSDVGTLETVLGNILVTDLGLSSTCNAEIIGYFVDDQNKDIYLFVTNFVDTSSDRVSNYPSDDALCQIWKRNIETNINTKLVEGKFLNFSLTHPIYGINLIEDLLFWTDNRNQPRKINVNSANPGSLANPIYYTNDDQINVAKYYPYDTISLAKDYIVDFTINSRGTGSPVYNDYINQVVPTSGGGGVGLTVEIVAADAGTGELEQIRIVDQGQGYVNNQFVTIAPKIGNASIKIIVEESTTMKDKCTEKLPVNTTLGAPTAPIANTITAGTPFTIDIPIGTPSYVGALVKINAGATVSPYLARVTAQSGTGAGASMTVTWANKYNTGPVYFPSAVAGITSIELGINPDYDANWPGDCQFLKDKFVRFAYRFKFDDNEYSLISPFTQPCFIPKQNGYFLSETRNGTPVLDTEQAYDDTDNAVMENLVTAVDIQIPCPEFLDDTVDNKFKNLTDQLHVKEIDIIYKDDSENVLKVLDTLSEESFSNLDYETLIYTYQSRKPKKTLPSSEITRVSDKVPIRALAQEVTGNRVIYGNYVDGYTAMNNLDYEVSAVKKLETSSLKKEYPNHTLKQNRSYQVGVVLVDRYGRNSDVVLSSLDIANTTSSNVVFKGSTVFHPFYTAANVPGLVEATKGWNGDALRVKFNSKIPLTIPKAGYPGLFLGYASTDIANLYGGGGYLTGTGNLTTIGGTGTGLTVNITIDISRSGGPTLGIAQTVTINNPGTGYKQGDIITITGGTPTKQATFVYNPSAQPNLTGWYSYKIVVKQTEQDYYNVYLPGIVNGLLSADGLNSVTEASMSMFGDNINKVPKDLSTVGPSQTNYNSTENLTLRVNNTTGFSSEQFYPGTDIEKVTQISELTDLGISLTKISKDVKAYVASATTFTYEGLFDENIQPGMAMTVIDSSGVTKISLADGFYVLASYTNGVDPEVKLNAAPDTVYLITALDTVTFSPPGVVYNSGNNPLIGIMSTSAQIGVSEQSGFKTQLAVAETQPTESLLDIYYETTSTGSISDLNLLVEQGIALTIPVKVTNVDFTLNEGQTGAQTCTNTFTLLSNLNTPIIGKNISGEIVSVFDRQNPPVNRTHEFSITDDNNGTFSLATTKFAGNGYYVGEDLSATTFDFNLLMTNDTYEIPVQFTGSINNVKPIYQGASGNDQAITINKSSLQGTFGVGYVDSANEGVPWKCLNGSGDLTLDEKEIRWELVSAIAIDGENSPVPDDYPGVVWPVGYESNPNATSVASYTIQKNVNYLNLFEFLDPVHRNTKGYLFSRVDTLLNFAGLNQLGDQTFTFNAGGDEPNLWDHIFNPDYQGPQTQTSNLTASLVQFVKFELKIKAVDRNGSGEAGVAGGTDSEHIVITVTVQ